MPHLKQNKRHISGENIVLLLMIGLLAILAGGALFLSLFFDFRYTESFAIDQLRHRGFEQITVQKEYSVGRGHGLVTFPVENWFDFTAQKEGKSVESRLICYRQFQDIEKSRCEVADL